MHGCRMHKATIGAVVHELTRNAPSSPMAKNDPMKRLNPTATTSQTIRRIDPGGVDSAGVDASSAAEGSAGGMSLT
jgi:hypothetical protein